MSAWLRWRLTANIFARIDCIQEWKIEVNGPCLNAFDDTAEKKRVCRVEASSLKAFWGCFIVYATRQPEDMSSFIFKPFV